MKVKCLEHYDNEAEVYARNIGDTTFQNCHLKQCRRRIPTACMG